MPDSLLTSLYSLLDPRTVGGVADSLGTSKQSALQGLKSGIAAVLAGMLGKAEDPNALCAVLHLGPKLSEEISLAQCARAASDPNSPMVSASRHILSVLFGPSRTIAIDAVGTASGLQAGESSTVLTMTAPLVTNFIANRVATEGMNMHDLGHLLQRESSNILSAVPRGLGDLLWPPAVTPSSPGAPRAADRERQAASWLPLLAVIILVPALMWLFSHTRRVTGLDVAPTPAQPQTLGNAHPAASIEPPATGSANRTETDPVELVKRLLANNVDLRFDTGSATLRPESRRKLEIIRSTIVVYPDVHLTLTGHTDNTGGADVNRRLARRRAETVMADLIRKGVPTDHLSAESEEEPRTIADNSTEEGRAQNRCVTLDVSQH